MSLELSYMCIASVKHECLFYLLQLGRKLLLVGGGLLMALLNIIAATLIITFNLDQEDNIIVSYIVVCLVCLFVFVFTGTW